MRAKMGKGNLRNVKHIEDWRREGEYGSHIRVGKGGASSVMVTPRLFVHMPVFLYLCDASAIIRQKDLNFI